MQRAIVVDHVVVMEEEHDHPGRVAVALRLVEEQLLVVTVAGGAPVDHLDPAARAAQRRLEDLRHGLGQRHRVPLDEGVTEGQDPRGAAWRVVAALGVPQPAPVDRHLDRVLAPPIDDARPRRLAPAEDRVVLDVAADLGRLLAPTLAAPKQAHRHLEREEGEQGRGEDEEERSETLTDGLRHLG